MKAIFSGVVFGAVFALSVSAQDANTSNNSSSSDCPPDKVCISRAAAEKAVETAKELDATKLRLIAETSALEAMRQELNDMRAKFAAASGEITALKQNAVQDRAIIAELLKSAKKKCYPFSICF